MIPNSYILKFDEYQLMLTAIEATLYKDSKPCSWGIKMNGNVMSKIDGLFYIEPTPSSRDESFLNEFRFETSEKAKECYDSFHK